METSLPKYEFNGVYIIGEIILSFCLYDFLFTIFSTQYSFRTFFLGVRLFPCKFAIWKTILHEISSCTVVKLKGTEVIAKVN